MDGASAPAEGNDRANGMLNKMHAASTAVNAKERDRSEKAEGGREGGRKVCDWGGGARRVTFEYKPEGAQRVLGIARPALLGVGRGVRTR